MVLLLVLVVLAMLSLTAYTFAEWMLAEYESTDAHGRSVQAQALAFSGVELLKVRLGEDPQTLLNLGGMYDNAPQFQGRLVLDDPQAEFRGRFAVIARSVDDEGYLGGIRFGLEDESTRLNLSTLISVDATGDGAARALLMGLPGMTEEVADAILDWIDADDELREFGAEANEYAALDPPYAPKNGPLETIEELLLVQGVTPWLLFGADANRNGIIDPEEEAATGLLTEDSGEEGALDFGWSAYLTLHSMENNLDADGLPRIDINQDDLETLHDALAEALGEREATFIVAMRQFGPYTPRTRGEASTTPVTLDFDQPGSFTFTTILDLIGPMVQVRQAGADPITLATPFPDNSGAMGGYLPDISDKLTVNSSTTIPGRININQAPRAVLLGIPGMSEEVVDQIISLRQPEDDGTLPARQHETWLLLEGLVTLDEMKQLMPFVCAGGNVYRGQVVGYYEQEGPAARIEVVLDTTGGQRRLVFWRDISHLGQGFPLETLGLKMP